MRLLINNSKWYDETPKESLKKESLNWINCPIDEVVDLCNYLRLDSSALRNLLVKTSETFSLYDYFFIAMPVLQWEEGGSIVKDTLFLLVKKNVLITITTNKTLNIIEGVIPWVMKMVQRKSHVKEINLIKRIVDYVNDSLTRNLDVLDQKLSKIFDHNALLETKTEDLIQKTFEIRRILISFKEAVWKRKITVSDMLEDIEGYLKLNKDEKKDLKEIYVRLDEHTEIINTTSARLNQVIDIHGLLLSNKMNRVMSRLTIVISLLMPASVIGSIFGMNFFFDPRGLISIGSFIFNTAHLELILVLGSILVMIIYVRKKKLLQLFD